MQRLADHSEHRAGDDHHNRCDPGNGRRHLVSNHQPRVSVHNNHSHYIDNAGSIAG